MRILTLAALAALTLPAAAMAQSSPVAVGGNLGTPGVGLSAQVLATDSVILRGDLDWMKWGYDRDYDGVNYDGTFKALTGGVFADWHPGAGAFFVSGGAYLGDRKLNLDATPAAATDIGGTVYTPAQIGRIKGSAKLSKFQPFAGLGIDNTWVGDRTWGFRALAGVAFSKKPDVNLTATGGLLASDPTFLARLQQEEDNVADDAKKVRYFPVLQIGFTRRF